MWIKSEARKRVEGFTDLLDYFAPVDDGILMLVNGSFLAGWELRGPDMPALSFDENQSLCARLGRAFHLGAGWTLQTDLIRVPSGEYLPACEWPDPVSGLIDTERRVRFALDEEHPHYVSRYFMSVCYRPIHHSGKKSQEWFFDQDEREDQAEQDLAVFKRKVAALEEALCANLLRHKHTFIRRLQSHNGMDDLCRYIRLCISGEDYPFALPDPPIYLTNYFAGDFIAGGMMRFDGKDVSVLAVDKFPKSAFAGILRELDSVPYPFRFCEQAESIDEWEAHKLHFGNARKWEMKKVGWAVKLLKKGFGRVDKHAQDMEADADAAANKAEHGQDFYARYAAKVILMDTSKTRMAEATEEIQRVLRYAGFSSRLETIAPAAAWISSFPGNMHRERRISVVDAENLANMAPLSSPFRGLETNPHPRWPKDTPPVFYAVTAGKAPFRFHLHVGDRGHTAITGPTGSGKTTLAALTCVQYLRFPHSQVFCFDKKKTLYTLTKAIGGDFYDLGAANSLRFCPLQYLETEADIAWAQKYIEMLCTVNGLSVTPAHRNAISETTQEMAGQAGLRSLTDFQSFVPSSEVKEALQFYTVGSAASAGLLDGQSDNLKLSRFSVFELNELYQMDHKITTAVLFYLFRRIQKRLRAGVPTLVSADEFRSALDHPMAVANFENFLIEGRKDDLALLIAIQEIGRLHSSPLKDTIARECVTKIFLPNPAAKGVERYAYEAYDLSDVDIDFIAEGQPCRDYYYTSEEGKRMISLELGPVALSFLAASSPSDREIVDELIERNPHAWPAEWLHRRGLPQWGEMLENALAQLQAKEVAAYA